MNGASATQRTWSMSATDVRAFLNAFGRLGYEADALLASAGLGESDFDGADARIPCEALGAMVSRAQQLRFTPNIALAAAQVTPLGAYPLLDYLVATSESVGSGIQQLARYFRLVGNPVVIDIDETRDPIGVDLGTSAAPFGIEYSAALIVLHLRAETDGAFRATAVAFQHTPDDLLAFEHALGCAIRSGSPANELTVTREAWALPLRRRDAVLRRLLEAHAEHILAHLPARTGLAADVQRVLASRIGEGDMSMDACARLVAMSGRTLQRRLAAEGMTYHELLDEARKGAAARLLDERRFAISEVAYLVGYAEPAPFTRAFKRWYGVTPEVFRRTRRGTSA